jgi:hypothetical protein
MKYNPSGTDRVEATAAPWALGPRRGHKSEVRPLSSRLRPGRSCSAESDRPSKATAPPWIPPYRSTCFASPRMRRKTPNSRERLDIAAHPRQTYIVLQDAVVGRDPFDFEKLVDLGIGKAGRYRSICRKDRRAPSFPAWANASRSGPFGSAMPLPPKPPCRQQSKHRGIMRRSASFTSSYPAVARTQTVGRPHKPRRVMGRPVLEVADIFDHGPASTKSSPIIAAAIGIARSARARRRGDGWPSARPSCCPPHITMWSSRKHRKGCASRRVIWKGWCSSGLGRFSRVGAVSQSSCRRRGSCG